jgi:hypothetical protein
VIWLLSLENKLKNMEKQILSTQREMLEIITGLVNNVIKII